MSHMATYDEIKDLLNAKLEVDQAQHATILQKIAELKEDTQEIKKHAKETNGNVAKNLERIHRLEVDQAQDNKARKRQWWFYSSLVIFIVGEIFVKFIL